MALKEYGRDPRWTPEHPDHEQADEVEVHRQLVRAWLAGYGRALDEVARILGLRDSCDRDRQQR